MFIHAFRGRFVVLVLAAAVVVTMSGCTVEAQPPAQAPASELATASPAASARVARQLTAEELVQAALPVRTVANLVGEPASVYHAFPDEAKVEFLAGPECREILDAVNGQRIPAPRLAFQPFTWTGDRYGGSSLLASYEGSGAKEAFATVREGLKACRYFERQSPAGLYKGTLNVLAAPEVGEEVVRFEIAAPLKLGPSVTEYTVVRAGSTVVSFSKLSVAGRDVRAFPAALITEQVTRLQEAQQ
ncbi:hypothetical protein [Streptomyces sp. NPDC056549]|uniref:hypothetical protein n=1 Tax=Streptomyces sp. NPDC056549 TaxID=3345864 RepID=UPI00367A4972